VRRVHAAIGLSVTGLAEDQDGIRLEASRFLDGSVFRCPECGWGVVLKRGRVKVSHFAHLPAGPSCGSAGESVEHMRGKALLAERFRAYEYEVVLEDRGAIPSTPAVRPPLLFLTRSHAAIKNAGS
jgi:competence protein CoiA-like protein